MKKGDIGIHFFLRERVAIPFYTGQVSTKGQILQETGSPGRNPFLYRAGFNIDEAKKMKEKLFDGASVAIPFYTGQVSTQDQAQKLDNGFYVVSQSLFIQGRFQHINCYQMVRFGSVLSVAIPFYTGQVST